MQRAIKSKVIQKNGNSFILIYLISKFIFLIKVVSPNIEIYTVTPTIKTLIYNAIAINAIAGAIIYFPIIPNSSSKNIIKVSTNL